MKDAQNDDPDFQRSIKAVARACEGIADLRPWIVPNKKNVLLAVDENTRLAPEIRVTLFPWFVDVRKTLKGR